MPNTTGAIAALLLLAPALNAAHGAVISKRTNPRGIELVRIEGEIREGDADRFIQFLQANEIAKSMVGGPLVELSSPGGSFVDGLLLGDAIFETGSRTIVRSGDKCFSACAFAFLGGRFVGTVGSWRTHRQLEPGAMLGFHGYYRSQQPSQTAEESQQFNHTLKTVQFLNLLLSNALSKWKYIDPGFISFILTVAPDDMYIIRRAEDFQHLHIHFKPSEAFLRQHTNARFACEKVVRERDSSTGGKGRLKGPPTRLTAEFFESSGNLARSLQAASQEVLQLLEGAVQEKNWALYDRLVGETVFRTTSRADIAQVVPLERGAGFYYDRCIAYLDFGSAISQPHAGLYLWDALSLSMSRVRISWYDMLDPELAMH